MLYMHCGWPRTSTTSLQAALVRSRERLAAAGLTYPDPQGGPSVAAHDTLYAMLEEMHRSGQVGEELRRLLDDSRRDVLLSAEGISNWVPDTDRRAAVESLLSEVETTMPATYIWTLRRIDDAAASLYMLGLWAGIEMPPAAEAIDRWEHRDNPFNFRRLEGLFAGMKQLANRVKGGAIYLRYDREGGHNTALLHALDLEDSAVTEISRVLERGPRRNVRVSHKQAAALLSLDELSARAGTRLDPLAVRQAIGSGKLSFEDDRTCQPIDGETKRKLHRRALDVADKQGFSAYIRFFEDDEVKGPTVVTLDAGALTDRDLKQLESVAGNAEGSRVSDLAYRQLR